MSTVTALRRWVQSHPRWVYHHGHCCPHRPHTGGAGINAAPPLAITTGGPGIIAVVPPPSNQGRLALSNILEYAKMPAFHWRQILSAHNTTRPGGESLNQELEKLLVAGEDGHRLSLKMPNSYRCDDGLAVHTYTDDRACSASDAKAQVCKAALVELLLRAPNRGSVRLLDGAQLTRNGWSVERIWDEVHRIQLQMHGISCIGEAPPMGGAGINAAPPPQPPPTAKQDTPIQIWEMFFRRGSALPCSTSQVAARRTSSSSDASDSAGAIVYNFFLGAAPHAAAVVSSIGPANANGNTGRCRHRCSTFRCSTFQVNACSTDADRGAIKFMGGHQHLHDAEHDISTPNGRTQRDRMTRARLRRTGSRCQRPPRSAPAPWSSTRRTTIEQQGRVWGVWHSCTCSMSCGLASVSTVCADFRLAASQHGSTRRSCRSPLLPGRTVDTPATHVPLNMHVHRHRR